MMKTLLICLSLVSCLFAWEGDRFDTTIEDFDTLTVNFLLIVDGKAYFFDTLFLVDPTLVDTSYYVQTGTHNFIDSDNLHRFSIGGAKQFTITGTLAELAKNVDIQGSILRVDADGNSEITLISFFNSADSIYYDSLSQHFILTASTMWLSGDTTYWVDATGADTNWCYNTGTYLMIGGDNTVQIKQGLVLDGNFYAIGDTRELRSDGEILALDYDADDDTVFFYANGTNGLLRYIVASDQWEFTEDVVVLRKFTVRDSFIVYDDSVHMEKTIRFMATGANSPTLGKPLIWTSFTDLSFSASKFTWKSLAGATWMAIDASGNFSINNLATFQDSVYFIVGADTGWVAIVNDTLRINGNIPIKVGAGSIIIANDCVTISTELLVDGDLIWGTDGGLSFGEIYVQGNTNATSINFVNTWEQFVDFTNDGQSNNCSPDATSNHILISEAGIYQVLASVSFTGGKDDQYEVQIYKNDGATALANLFSTRFINNVGEYGSISISGLASFAVNDSVELWIRDVTNNTDAILKDVNLSLLQIGK